MAVQLILPSDKLQSGFRAKYNSSANAIWITAEDNGDGTVTITKFDTSTIILDLTDSFFTKTEITDLLAAIASGAQKTEIEISAAEMASFSGTKSGMDLTITAGTIVITNYDDLITKHGYVPDITFTTGNYTGTKLQGVFDNQDTPTTLTIETGVTTKSVLKLI